MNDQGVATLQDGTVVRYGLGNNSSDLTGVKTITITPGMIGKKIGVSVWAEVKIPGKNATEPQQNFLNKMLDMGAIAGVVRSENDVDFLFDSYVAKLQS